MTGKTESAIRVGVAAQEKYGRTFFYLHNADQFASTIPYIKNYQPCLTFVEDVDQITGGDRDTDMNTLLNQLDGNELKNVDCTFIFTTNNRDKIHPSMRRPGRIDQLIHFGYCDKRMVAEIYKIYANGFAGASEVDYDDAAAFTPDDIQGAIVAEIGRRAQKYADKLHEGVMSTEVFKDAIASMKSHIDFMKEDQRKDLSAEALLAQIETIVQKKAFPQNFEDPYEAKSKGTFADVVALS